MQLDEEFKARVRAAQAAQSRMAEVGGQQPHKEAPSSDDTGSRSLFVNVHRSGSDRVTAELLTSARQRLQQAFEQRCAVRVVLGERAKQRQISTPPSDPGAALDWMNARYFVAPDGGRVNVMSEEFDPDLERDVLVSYSFTAIRDLYCNRRVVVGTNKNGKEISLPLGRFWQEHADRREFKGIVLSPNGHVPGYYNLWRGFSVDPKQGDWSLMDAHIRHVICAGNDELYAYVRGWLAFAVQKPGTLPETALVMRGKQGTGKGVFARGFGELFGQHFLHLNTAKHLVARFNAHLRDAVLVFADEAFLAGDPEVEGQLKTLISEPVLQIEQKFKDQKTRRNLIHLIAASNNERVINASAEERRYCVLDVSDGHIQDRRYFGAIKKQLEEGGRAAMLFDLLQDDLGSFDIREIPKTGALVDQKLKSLSAIQKWWLSKLQSGDLSNGTWRTAAAREELAEACSTHTRSPVTTQTLRNELVKLLPNGFPADAPRASIDGERKRQWALPPLEECREHFDKVYGTSGLWPD